GSIRWYCTYPPPVVVDPATGAIQPETRCNGVDEDCDGATDENWPGVRHSPTDPADSCTAGIGGCRRPGVFVCTGDGLNEVCNATAGAPVAEACNGIDDNCDGLTDNGITQDNFAAWGAVQIQGAVDANRPRDGARESPRNFYVMQWEASRPDATATSAGTITTQRVCSRTGVLPWTDITWTQARDACCRLNNTGT
ncbi:MAG: MopE-related protein, partial [Myxococcota bacterium]|nr:MopE-related protein [Myxococcota bacterium]